ncbi:class I adenylate-forming enzyme family protein [Conexibacter sp. CPCC 206217]|uniref:class I adenylate-forming enzyme family protein n=1 Tax=Conexibacter sp. CPCC 206217 TaxID=3064574 RepID=UPI00272391DB|nr:AMP-binding protein [Conexibacter sp. CPCC 206217]MDO8212603.1 AMP-binding protein [Conexibacter sp. CPCC 206217]
MSVYTISEIVSKPTQRERDRTAVRYGEQSLTFGELEGRAERLAAGLSAAGFQQGDRCCVLMHNRLEWFELFFALARLGGVLVPVNHLLTPHEIKYIVEDSGATWFVAEEQLWERAEGVRELLASDGDAGDLRYVAIGGVRPAGGERFGAIGDTRADTTPYERLLAPAPLAVRPDVGADDLFLLQYTSGTTGFPKGAEHTHSTVMWNAISQRQHFMLDETAVYLCLPALSWVAGFHSLCLETLWSGGTAVVNPTDEPFSAERFCDLVERHGATHVALVPTVMARILALEGIERRDLSSLRVAIAGGAAVPVHLMEEMGERLPGVTVLQVYGMSEFPSLVTLLEPQDVVAKMGSAGKANCVSQVRVVDAEDRDLPAGEVGEILTRSPATMIGYHGLPDATAATLRGGWLHTGDLGHLDGDGYLFISGRSKDLIISGGLNVYPVEVEQVLDRHPAVIESAVVGVPDPSWGEVVKAVVVLDADGSTSEQELHDHLAGQVARYKLPKLWELRVQPPLPRTASGKLQKFKLLDRAGAR